MLRSVSISKPAPSINAAMWRLRLHPPATAFSKRLKRSCVRATFASGNCVVQGAEFLGENLCITYHPESSMRALFATGFEVVEFVPEGAKGNPSQDLWLLRKV